jgi:hypothetical protein
VPVPRTDPEAVHALGIHALLSQALVAFTIDVEERTGVAIGIAAMLAQSMPGPTALLTALPRLLGVTGGGKSLVERHGFIRVSRAGAAKIATLTPRAERIRDAHGSTVAATEQDWRAHHGAAAGELAGALAAVEARLPSDLPDHLAVRYERGHGFADVCSIQ